MLKFSLILLLALMAGYAYAQDDLDSQTYTPPPTPYTCPSFTVSAIADFGSPTGLFGNSKVYNANDGTQVTAYGYLYPSTPKPLYGKNAGVGETGLGMNDDAGNDHEIDKSHYVQLDITKIRQTMAVGTQITIQIGSAQSGEGFQIYGSSAQGTRGNLITSGTGPGTQSVVTVSFAPTTNFIAVVATGSASDANVLIVSISFCRAPAFVVGDPQFIGLRGQSYQVHGVSGEVYNIVSDVDFQYNSRFVFLDQGECPVIDGKKQKGCFSHPGSFLGEIGIKTRAGDKIHLVSGGAQQGFQLVEFNGKTVEIGETNVLAGDLGSFAYNSTHITAIKVGKWEFTFENSDMFVNQKVMVTNFKNLRSHGLLGQTWKDAKYPNALKVIAGDVDDYVIRRSDIFGDDFVFNVFN